jgi:hypothetical protein
MDISARALLVNTTVRVWTGEKRDRAITREICTMKGAEDNAVRANKSLLGEHIHGVQAAERAVRHAVNERTLPWMDDGTRILKGSVFMAFTEAMADPIRQFDEAVDAFIATYPEIRHEARRVLPCLTNPSMASSPVKLTLFARRPREPHAGMPVIGEGRPRRPTSWY